MNEHSVAEAPAGVQESARAIEEERTAEIYTAMPLLQLEQLRIDREHAGETAKAALANRVLDTRVSKIVERVLGSSVARVSSQGREDTSNAARKPQPSRAMVSSPGLLTPAAEERPRGEKGHHRRGGYHRREVITTYFNPEDKDQRRKRRLLALGAVALAAAVGVGAYLAASQGSSELESPKPPATAASPTPGISKSLPLTPPPLTPSKPKPPETTSPSPYRPSRPFVADVLRLPAYNRQTGSGTVWYATKREGERLGLQFSDPQLVRLMPHMLRYNHITNPRELPVGYQVKFPSEQVLTQWAQH